jgi:hypothetical protein
MCLGLSCHPPGKWYCGTVYEIGEAGPYTS